MQYVASFDNPEFFKAASAAVKEDLRNQDIPQVKFDQAHSKISFDMTYLEAGAIFGRADSKARAFLPFSGNGMAPTPENFRAVGEERNIKDVHIERVAGSITDSFLERRKEAENFFSSNYFTQTPKAITPDNSPLESVMEANLKHNKALIIGECHGDKAHYSFIEKNIGQIKAGNGKALLLEHFFISEQPMIDKWIAAPAGTPMPLMLEKHISLLDEGMNNSKSQQRGNNTLRNLFETMKNNGIRIIAIETEESMTSLSGGLAQSADKISDGRLYGEYERFLLMNYNAAKVWESEKGNSGGIPVALAGANHMPDWVQKRIDGEGKTYTHREVPGLSRIFGGEIINPVDPDTYPKLLTQGKIEDRTPAARMLQGIDHVFSIDAETGAATAFNKKKLLSGIGYTPDKPAINYDTSDPTTERMLELKKNSQAQPGESPSSKIDIPPSMQRALEQAKDAPKLAMVEVTAGDKSPTIISTAYKTGQQNFRA